MKKIVVDMQNFLFADSIATAFKNSDYDIAVVRAESPRDTIELCRVFKPFVLLMEVTAYLIAVIFLFSKAINREGFNFGRLISA